MWTWLDGSPPHSSDKPNEASSRWTGSRRNCVGTAVMDDWTGCCAICDSRSHTQSRADVRLLRHDGLP